MMKSKPQDIEVWLEQLGLPSADRDYKPGHARVHHLIQAIEKIEAFKQPALRIRIAGTNGKGSTANFIASALQANGLKVGLYTSPHILSFNERMQVNQEPISQKKLVALMTLIMPLALDVGTSYFETATVLALLYFSRENVDVEILEAGVGAKLDATTAVPADIGLLTPVGFDHQDWLGNTLSEITRDKAYVFQGCKHSLSVEQASEVTHILNDIDKNVIFSRPFTQPLVMLGEHQQQNAGLAFSALQSIKNMGCELGLKVDLDICKQSIQHKRIVGRLEYMMCRGNHFWLDAAHNEHAINALLPTLEMMHFDLILLCTREDRDLSVCVPSLACLTKRMVVMTGGLDYAYMTVSDALSAEVKTLNNGNILVLGSFITLNSTMEWIKKHAF